GEGCNQHITAVEKGPADQGGTWKPRDRFVGSGTVPPNTAPANPAWNLILHGSIAASDPATGATVRKVNLGHVNRPGVMAAAGVFVTTGDYNGCFRAYDETTLAKL